VNRKMVLGLALISIGVIGILSFSAYLLRPSPDIGRASNIAQQYLESLNNPDLAIAEILEFEQNFYVVYFEQSTGIGAFEMLIDKNTGRIFPEYGPNMMWNTKYGHGGMMCCMRSPTPFPSAELPIREDEAVAIAQEFLDQYVPGTVAEDPHPFYGYYTIHVSKGGKTFGMLSVHGTDGTVWYHNWHGAFVQSVALHEE
jgi:hypothetical protein